MGRGLQKLDEALSVLAAAVLACQPALPVFCRNIHVGCAGRLEAATAGFVIRPEAGELTFENGEVWSVEVSASHSGVVYRAGRSWVRVSPELRFSQRVYGADGVMMTYGVCSAAD